MEWCERRILQRIHKLTIGARRRQVEPVSPAKFMHWLLRWQHLAPQTQVSGEDGLLEAISKLEGFEAPAVEWEKSILPSRVANYDPRWLDQLCLSGLVGWGRVSPHPAFHEGNGSGPQRVIPTNASPITFICVIPRPGWTTRFASKPSTARPGLHSECSPDMGVPDEQGCVLRGRN
jgi:ATP-dependent helicase Lhr and Lhr-like helicase